MATIVEKFYFLKKHWNIKINQEFADYLGYSTKALEKWIQVPTTLPNESEADLRVKLLEALTATRKVRNKELQSYAEMNGVTPAMLENALKASEMSIFCSRLKVSRVKQALILAEPMAVLDGFFQDRIDLERTQDNYAGRYAFYRIGFDADDDPSLKRISAEFFESDGALGYKDKFLSYESSGYVYKSGAFLTIMGEDASGMEKEFFCGHLNISSENHSNRLIGLYCVRGDYQIATPAAYKVVFERVTDGDKQKMAWDKFAEEVSAEWPLTDVPEEYADILEELKGNSLDEETHSLYGHWKGKKII